MKIQDFSNFQIDEKNDLLEKLKTNKTIQEFMDKYDCPFSVIEANSLIFAKWLEDLDRLDSYDKQTLRSNPNLGGYVDLSYDQETESLNEEFTFLEFSEELIKEKEHLSNYRVFDLHKSLLEAEFNKLVLDNKDTASYLTAVKEMIEFTKNDELGLYLYGDLGVGKSYLSACATNKFAKENKSVAFVSPADLLSHLKSFFGTFEIDNSLEILKNVDLLVIDDLGAESITPWGRDEIMLPLLNARMENFKKTIFTSNYPPNLLESVYERDQRGNKDVLRGKRFVDRVLAIGRPIEIIGYNRRRTSNNS